MVRISTGKEGKEKGFQEQRKAKHEVWTWKGRVARAGKENHLSFPQVIISVFPTCSLFSPLQHIMSKASLLPVNWGWEMLISLGQPSQPWWSRDLDPVWCTFPCLLITCEVRKHLAFIYIYIYIYIYNYYLEMGTVGSSQPLWNSREN